MTDISLPFKETKTSVHSEEALRAQRFRALAKDQCALSGVSLYGQLVIGLSLYLYPFVSTPGYLSILLTLPFLLFLGLSARRLLKNTPPGENLLLFAGGKGLGKAFAFSFALIFFLDSLLAAYALTAMMQTVLPDMSPLLISLSVTAVMAVTIAGSDLYALHRLARFLRWIFLFLFFFCALTTLSSGSTGHFFPLLGAGEESIFRGALWLIGCMGGACCPFIMPLSRESHEPLVEKKRILLRPLLFALAAGMLTAMLSAFLMPFYALSRPESLGWRLLLIPHISPSLAVWSLFLCGQMFLMLVTLAAGVTRASAMLCLSLGNDRHKPLLITLLLFLQLPFCALNLESMESFLCAIAPFRGALAGGMICLMLLLSEARKRRERREMAP